jgi:copper(I)-binding protein
MASHATMPRRYLVNNWAILSGMRQSLFLTSIALLWLFAKGSLAGDIMVTQASVTAPVVATAKTAAATMILMNHGAVADRLLGLTTPVADYAEIHQTVEADGMVSMKPVEAIELAPGQAVDLSTLHMHIMLSGLHGPVKVGDKVSLELRFEKSQPITVEATVSP